MPVIYSYTSHIHLVYCRINPANLLKYLSINIYFFKYFCAVGLPVFSYIFLSIYCIFLSVFIFVYAIFLFYEFTSFVIMIKSSVTFCGIHFQIYSPGLTIRQPVPFPTLGRVVGRSRPVSRSSSWTMNIQIHRSKIAN